MKFPWCDKQPQGRIATQKKKNHLWPAVLSDDTTSGMKDPIGFLLVTRHDLSGRAISSVQTYIWTSHLFFCPVIREILINYTVESTMCCEFIFIVFCVCMGNPEEYRIAASELNHANIRKRTTTTQQTSLTLYKASQSRRGNASPRVAFIVGSCADEAQKRHRKLHCGTRPDGGAVIKSNPPLDGGFKI